MTTSTIVRQRGALVPGSDEWRSVVTGSKIAGILGLGHTGEAKTWLLMRGDIEPDDTTSVMLRGTIQEPAILDWFFQVMHPEFGRIGHETTYTRDDLGFEAAANLDDVAIVIDEGGNEVHEGVEAKTVAYAKAHEWGKPGTDQIPPHYRVQIMWQMHMSGMTRTRVIKHGPFVDDYDEFIVDYDPIAAKHLEDTARAFVASVNDPDGVMPEVDGRESTFQAVRRIHPDIDADVDWPIALDAAIAYTQARQRVEQAESDLNESKSRILTAIGTARRAVVGEGRNQIVVARRQKAGKGVTLYPPAGKADAVLAKLADLVF